MAPITVSIIINIHDSRRFAGVQEKLGIMNNGEVYAVFDYEAQHSDELTLKNGDALVVLRKGDDNEREWWWSKLAGREGYVPRNLLGVSVGGKGGGVYCVI